MNNKKILFSLAAGIGGIVSGLLSIIFSFHDNAVTSWILTGATDAAFIGSAIIYIQNYYQYDSWFKYNSIRSGLIKGSLIGAGGGFIGLVSMGLVDGETGRYIGWALSGGAVGYVVSLRVPNLKISTAVFAGALGGALGCLVMTIGLGYVAGVAVAGAVIGYMVAFSEQVFRDMSIDVTLTPRVSGLSLAKPHCFNLTLGSTPITVGYTEDVDIYLQPANMEIKESGGKIAIESGKPTFTYSHNKKKIQLRNEENFIVENASIALKTKR